MAGESPSPQSKDRESGLPAFCRARTLVLGVGNILFGDDGFGPEVVDHLLRNYRIPDDIYVMDVGTGVRKLLFTLSLSDALPESIIIVDAIDGGRADGRVGEVDLASLPANKIDDFSLHHAPTSNLLRDLQERRGVDVKVVVCDVGVVPQWVQPGLSAQAARGVVEAARDVARRLGLEQATA